MCSSLAKKQSCAVLFLLLQDILHCTLHVRHRHGRCKQIWSDISKVTVTVILIRQLRLPIISDILLILWPDADNVGAMDSRGDKDRLQLYDRLRQQNVWRKTSGLRHGDAGEVATVKICSEDVSCHVIPVQWLTTISICYWGLKNLICSIYCSRDPNSF